jgi:hypothetical protein
MMAPIAPISASVKHSNFPPSSVTVGEVKPQGKCDTCQRGLENRIGTLEVLVAASDKAEESNYKAEKSSLCYWPEYLS